MASTSQHSLLVSSRVPVPRLALEAAADELGVCCRPVLRKVTDRSTGEVAAVSIPCGATVEITCRPCAEKARRLRMQQCREGWHLAEDPLGDVHLAESESVRREASGRRVRSTHRLAGMPELPKGVVAHRTVGNTFTDPVTGASFRPSMFVTLTLPSYGRVDSETGLPGQWSRYDYRRAALDAMLFPRLVDRFWQNLRRAAGYRVQYFAVVEAQRRLAPHLHAAVRGAIPRQVIRDTVAATYCAIWWPSIERVVYDEARGDVMPTWDPGLHSYVDPATGALLSTWAEAVAEVDADPEASPFHVLTFGRQLDMKGIIGGHEQTGRAIGYLCKYLTKSITDTYDDDAAQLQRQAHIARLHEEARWLPCSETCANWLRYGITPKDPTPGLMPGECPANAHARERLGLGGRRVLVSRHWTGKTLTDHRADRAEVVRQVLASAGVARPEKRRFAADILGADGEPRFVWAEIPLEERDYASAIAAAISETKRWRRDYELARQRAPAAVDNLFGNQKPSATRQPAKSRAAVWRSRVSEANP